MTTRRTAAKADDFATALEQNAAAMPSDPAIASLVAVAAGLAAIPLKPAPAFKDALRERLMAEAAQILPNPGTAPTTPAGPAPTTGQGAATTPTSPVTPAMPAPSGLGTGWLAGPAGQVLTGGLAVAVGISGTGLAAHRSIPGDPFYGLKRAVEDLRYRFAGSPVEEAIALRDQARERLDEIEALLPAEVSALSDDAFRRIEAALATLDADLRRAIERLLAAAVAGDARAYQELLALLSSTRAALVPLLAELPDALRDKALAVLNQVGVAGGVLATIPVPPAVTRTPSPAPTQSPSPSPSPSATFPTQVPTSPPTSLPPVSPSPSPSRTLLPPLPTPSLPLPLPGLLGGG